MPLAWWSGSRNSNCCWEPQRPLFHPEQTIGSRLFNPLRTLPSEPVRNVTDGTVGGFFGNRSLMTSFVAADCQNNASGRHFWIEDPEKSGKDDKRYRCRDCGKEVSDKTWPSGLGLARL